MKKVFVLATAALLISGVSFANGGDKKKGGKETEKACCKGMKDCKKDMKDCKMDSKKDAKTATPAAKKTSTKA